eukprot:5164553-Amphidinium_carterae.1
MAPKVHIVGCMEGGQANAAHRTRLLLSRRAARHSQVSGLPMQSNRPGRYQPAGVVTVCYQFTGPA